MGKGEEGKWEGKMKRRDMTVYLTRIEYFDFNNNIGTDVPDFHVYEFIENKEQEERDFLTKGFIISY